MNLLRQFRQSSTTTKFLALTVVMIWTIVLAMITAGVVLILERPSQALQPTPNQGAPAIALSPVSAWPGSSVTVQGTGWPAEAQVMIYLMNGDTPAYAVSSAVADSWGRFTTDFIFLPDPRWQQQGVAQFLAQTVDNQFSAQGFLMVLDLAVQPTDTATLPAAATATTEPTATPTEEVVAVPTATPQPAMLTANTNLNIRSGPGTNYALLGTLARGQSAEITGLSYDYNWWQIRFPAGPGGYGWVSASYVTAQNTGNVPLVQSSATPVAPTATPVPAPTATPVVIRDWRGEYYSNAGLSGAPALVRNDVAINFNWGGAAPAANLPADHFSARWTRAQYFDEGVYRFHIMMDDGARLWVDERLVIDAWTDGGAREATGDYWLGSGFHNLRLEYYERSGEARVALWWERLAGRPDDDDDDDDYPDWKAEYWSNRELKGSPKVTRNDRKIDFDWGTDAPRSDLPRDNFSVRWSRTVRFEEGRYRFEVRADDGVRLYIDGELLLDEWRSSDGSERYVVERNLSGRRQIVLEYYEGSGQARIKVNWQRVKNEPTATPTPTQTPTATPDPQTVALNAATGHLVALTGLPASEIRVVSITYVEWPNSQLGCSPDGVVSAPVITPGYQIILQARGQQYEYRSDLNGRVLLCQPQAPTATATATPTETPTSEPTATPTQEPTATPEPPTATPEPPTTTPEPPTATPEPPTATPEPPTATPEPPTVTPEPPTATPELPTVTPEPPTPESPELPVELPGGLE